MTEEEKKKMRDSFTKSASDEDITDPWTEEALLKVAEKILERILKDDK